MKQVSEDKEDFYCSVFLELKALGVKVPKVKKFKSTIPKQDKTVAVCSSKTFGVCLCDQEKVSSADSFLPKFIVVATSYLRRYTKKEIGLFRKAGSISRQRELRAKLERGESIEESEPNDVASLLKQWLRELPEPLIPSYLHDLFVRCSNLEAEENKVAAVLMCCHLLPPDHLHTLKHLLDFLSDIASNSDKNKMGAHNLALIMAPNIFVSGNDAIDKSGSFTAVQQHTSIIELLIVHAQKVGEISACSSSHSLEVEAFRNSLDLDSSIDILDYSPSKLKKKRGSGPINDLFSGIKKLVGQSTSPNPSKRLVPDDSRSASKRKADPEVQSMSPAKKQAIALNALTNQVMTTPNNKISQNVFGLIKEKTGSGHTRRKSFGLLMRKKKRQKSSKSSAAEEPKVSINTPSPFRESINMPSPFGEKFPVSFQDCLEPNRQIPTSPLLSQSDIDRIFSKTSIVKKSVSDCYLTVPNVEFKDVQVFSSFSSEGCLYSKGIRKSPYNLRSENSIKQAVKRKSDAFINEKKTFDFKGENHNQIETSQKSHRKCVKLSDNAETSKNKNLSPKDANVIIDTEITFNKINHDFPTSSSIQNHSTGVAQISNKRNSSQRKRNPENLKTPHVSTDKIIKKEKCTGQENCGREKDSSNFLSVEPISQRTISLSNLQKDETMQRTHSIKRQEAFRIRSKQRKASLSQVKSADPVVFSETRPKNITKYHIENSKSDKNNQRIQIEIAAENDQENASFCTPAKKRSKRNVRNGSIVRGRPNTIKTGLPSDLGNRYNQEIVSNSSRHDIVTATASVDNDVFIGVINHTEKDNEDVFINAVSHSESKDYDMSIIFQIENLALSSPPKSDKTKPIDTKENDQKCDLQTDVSVIKDTLTVPRKNNRKKICSNSDSKVHKTKRKSSKVARTNSFPEPMRKSSRIASKLKAVNSSSPKKCEAVEKVNGVEKENILPLDTKQDIPNNVVKTPQENSHDTENWVCGRQYLEAEPVFQEDAFNKRESIAMILKNNHGHVQAKVHMYDVRTRSSSTSTPVSHQFSTPAERIRSSQSLRMSQRRTASSLKSSRSASDRNYDSASRFKSRNFPLPPPPKFVIPELNTSSPKLSYPLKELTNISNGEESFNISPLTNSFNTSAREKSPLIRKDKSSLSLKITRNSYSGHTPYKVPTVARSESSPGLVKVAGKLVRKSQGSMSRSPSLITISDYNCSFSNMNNFSSPVFKARSTLSIEKLKSDQLIDEWHCEM